MNRCGLELFLDFDLWIVVPQHSSLILKIDKCSVHKVKRIDLSGWNIYLAFDVETLQ